GLRGLRFAICANRSTDPTTPAYLRGSSFGFPFDRRGRKRAAFSSLLVLFFSGSPYLVRSCPRSLRPFPMPFVPLRSRPYRSAFDLHASHLPLTQAPWKSTPEIHLRWRPLSAIYIHRIWRSQVYTSTGRHWRNSLRNLLPPRLPCCVLFCLRFSLP